MLGLELALKFLLKAQQGIIMNFMSYRSPAHGYHADTCPWGIGGYSSEGQVWRCEIPEYLLQRATLNMLELIASTIDPYIDLIEQKLHVLLCILSTTNSTTTNRWLRKSNFLNNSEEKEE